MVTHQFDVMHGVQVDGGERYSLVIWFSESEAARAAGSAPWVERAAEAGNSDAQFILAGFYYRGEFGKERDIDSAVHWFGESAARGNPLAQLWMATLYANGEGVEQDYTQAVVHWRAAAEQEHASAQFSMGWAYRDGLGVTVDKREAVRWFRRSAAQGDLRACDALELGAPGWEDMDAKERARLHALMCGQE